jgi:signal transduction histidine kinase
VTALPSSVRRLWPGWRDASIALVLTALAQLEIWGTELTDAPPVRSALISLLATVPVAWRRRAPLVVAGVVVAAFAAHLLALGVELIGFGAVGAFFVALFSVAAGAPPRRALLGAFAVVAASGVVHRVAEDEFGWSNAFFWAIEALVVIGGLYARRLGEATALERRALRLEEERERAAHAGAAEERARIARELHDVVAHGVALMVVQAEAGEVTVDDDPDRARASFVAIQRAGRDALVDLRQLLGVLRRDHPELLRSPQPAVANLDALLDQVRAAGLAVDLRVEGEAQPLPTGVELSAYRIVQEALTNVVKHAGRARAEVVVRYAPESLELEVLDDGQGPQANGGGHGLAGLRERVLLYGGELAAGAREGGGFRVRALLPLGGRR